jgi:hypothetical protein
VLSMFAARSQPEAHENTYIETKEHHESNISRLLARPGRQTKACCRPSQRGRCSRDVAWVLQRQTTAAAQPEALRNWLAAGNTKSAARATYLGCSRSPEREPKLAVGLLNAPHAAVVSVEVCGHKQQQELSQKRSAAGCGLCKMVTRLPMRLLLGSAATE